MSSGETNALRYVAGYVCAKLHKKLAKSPRTDVYVRNRRYAMCILSLLSHHCIIIYYTLFNYLCFSHMLLSRSFWNGLINIQLIVWLAIVASCVPPADSHMLARSVYHSGAVWDVRWLPLSEKLDARNSEDVLHQVYK